MSQKNISNSKQTFFEFPCKFPIKIMANNNTTVPGFIDKVLKKHIKKDNIINFKIRNSKTEKYVSITVIFNATSKNQLDSIYKDLSAHHDIHMVL